MAQFLAIDLLHQERGQGYWKFNNLHLKNIEFINIINKFIDVKLQESEKLNPTDKWIFMNQELEKKIKKFSKTKACKRDLIISQLSEKIMEMEYSLSKNHDDKIHDILLKSKSEIEELLEIKAKGTIFHTKIRWQEEGVLF